MESYKFILVLLIGLYAGAAKAQLCGGYPVCIGDTILDVNSNFQGRVTRIDNNSIIHYINIEQPGHKGLTTNESCMPIRTCGYRGGDYGNPNPGNGYPDPGSANGWQPSKYFRVELFDQPDYRARVVYSVYSMAIPNFATDSTKEYLLSTMIQTCRSLGKSQSSFGKIIKVGLYSRADEVICDAEVL